MDETMTDDFPDVPMSPRERRDLLRDRDEALAAMRRRRRTITAPADDDGTDAAREALADARREDIAAMNARLK